MAIKTQLGALRYNNRMAKIFAPELDRLKKVEAIAKEILTAIDTQKGNYPGTDNCHLVNIVQRIISQRTTLRD